MDTRLQEVLESLLVNIRVLGDEVFRLGRSEQFCDSGSSLQLIEHIRSSCICSLQNIQTIERKLHQSTPHAAHAPALDS